MLQFLRIRYVRARMAAYVDGELSAAERRFIARQIDADDTCYRLYRQHRALKQTLERELPVVGRADSAALESIWGQVQAELNKPDVPQRAAKSTAFAAYSLRYGMVAVACALVLLIPVALDAQPVRSDRALTAQQHPVPEQAPIHATVSGQQTTTASPGIALVSLPSTRAYPTAQPAVPQLRTPAYRTTNERSDQR